MARRLIKCREVQPRLRTIEVMRRIRSPWLLALPLMAAGSLAAHAGGYRLAIFDGHHRARDLELTGHSYLDHLPLLAALIAAFGIVALALAATDTVRRRPRPLAAWPFALLPPLSFVLQLSLIHI